MPSKLGLPLILAILATVGFGFMSIPLGRGMMMYGCFVFYAGFILALAQLDRRVLGYAIVLTACNPSGGMAPLSYSLILAVIVVMKDSKEVSRVLQLLMAQRWWFFLLLAAGTALLSVPLWSHDVRGFLTDFKQYVSRLPYLVITLAAIAITINNMRDALRLTALACILTAGTISVFYFLGSKGVPAEYVWNVGMFSNDSYMQIGNAYLMFTRTQMCIVLAVVAATSLAITVATLPRPTAVLTLATSGVCVYLIMQLGSTGSAFAMAVGMGVAAMGYVLSRPSAVRIGLSVVVVVVLGMALVHAVFQTDNFLAKRIDLKQRAGSIDRKDLWIGAAQSALVTPIGRGWTTEFALRQHTHNDFLSYLISFGWLAGTFYFTGCVTLGWWLLRRLLSVPRDATDMRALLLAGLAAITVYGVNSMLDMLSAGIGNFQTVWVLALVPAGAFIGAMASPGVEASRPAAWASPELSSY